MHDMAWLCRMDGWMDGWMDGRMDIDDTYTHTHIFHRALGAKAQCMKHVLYMYLGTELDIQVG